MHGLDYEYVQYGKPEKATFDYCKEVLLDQARAQGIDKISNFYMIGDNPEGDIEGANRMGW